MWIMRLGEITIDSFVTEFAFWSIVICVHVFNLTNSGTELLLC